MSQPEKQTFGDGWQQLLDVDLGRHKDLLAYRLAGVRPGSSRFVVELFGVLDQVSDQAETVGVNTVRGQPNNDVTSLHGVDSGKQFVLVDGTNCSTVGIVVSWLVHARHFTGFTADQSTASLDAPVGDTFHKQRGNIDVQLGGSKVVQEHQGLSTLNNQVVDIHGHQVDTDSVVNVHDLSHS